MLKAVQFTLNWATLHLLFSVVTTATVSAVRIMLASGRKPILEKGSTVLLLLLLLCHAQCTPPLDFEMGWTGELKSNRVFLMLKKTKRISSFVWQFKKK